MTTTLYIMYELIGFLEGLNLWCLVKTTEFEIIDESLKAEQFICLGLIIYYKNSITLLSMENFLCCWMIFKLYPRLTMHLCLAKRLEIFIKFIYYRQTDRQSVCAITGRSLQTPRQTERQKDTQKKQTKQQATVSVTVKSTNKSNSPYKLQNII